jgi:NADH:ubiquinone oxidoreductase subunit B-like Fe-S oxidoreductase
MILVAGGSPKACPPQPEALQWGSLQLRLFIAAECDSGTRIQTRRMNRTRSLGSSS